VVIHPVKVAIVEAMTRLEIPLSAVEIQRMLEDPDDTSTSLLSYHMRILAKCGAIKRTGSRFVRGAEQTFYFLAPAMTAGTDGSVADGRP